MIARRSSALGRVAAAALFLCCASSCQAEETDREGKTVVFNIHPPATPMNCGEAYLDVCSLEVCTTAFNPAQCTTATGTYCGNIMLQGQMVTRCLPKIPPGGVCTVPGAAGASEECISGMCTAGTPNMC